MSLASTLGFGALILLISCLAGRVGGWLGVIDLPDRARKVHARPTPLVGGIALFVPLTLVALAEATHYEAASGVFSTLAAAGFSFMVLGWIDDRGHLSPRLRLVVATSLALSIFLLQPQLRLHTLQFGGLDVRLGYLALPFTILCLIGLQNAINMIDGLNGLLISLCLFWIVCLLMYAPPHLSYYLILMLLGLSVLLPFNLSGHLFLGDAGSYSLGVVIGLTMIHVYHESPDQLPMGTVVLWLMIPVIDCLRVMVERVLTGRSPLAGDRNHLHHVLLRRFSDRTALLVYLAIAALPGLLAAVWPSTTGAMAATAVLGWVVVLLWIRTSEARGSKAVRGGSFGRTLASGRWVSSSRPRP